VAPGYSSHAAWVPPIGCLPRTVRRGAHDAELAGARENSAGGGTITGGARGMAEQHSFACLEACRLGTRSVKIERRTPGVSHGSVAVQRAHKVTPRQMCDGGLHTVGLDSIKLTNAGARPELADLQAAGHAHRPVMPSAELRRYSPLWLTNTVGGGLFATIVLPLAAATGCGRCSHRQLTNDRGGRQ
jgi:hypothetical protein